MREAVGTTFGSTPESPPAISEKAPAGSDRRSAPWRSPMALPRCGMGVDGPAGVARGDCRWHTATIPSPPHLPSAMNATRPGATRVIRPVATLVTTALFGLTGCDRGAVPDRDDLDALPALTAQEEQRIGDVGDPALGFSRVFQADVDRDGNLFVLESSVPEIRVFSPVGTLLRRIGRRGAGPGEFESPIFGVLGDTVWTVDNALNRIALFDRQGTLLSTGNIEQVRIPLPESYGYLRPRVLRPDGRFMSFMGQVGSSIHDDPTGVEPTDRIPVPLVLFDPSGAVVDTAGWAPRPPPRMWRPPAEDDIQYQTLTVGGRRFMVPSPPTVLPAWIAVPDGYVSVETPLPQTADEGVVRVSRIAASGDTVYHRELRYTPQPYSDADLDSIASRAARGAAGGMAPVAPMGGGGGPPPPDDPELVARRLRDRMRFPKFRLPMEGSWVAQDGSVWLKRPDGVDPLARWVVLDPEGTPRGAVRLPDGARVVWNRGDSIWAVVPDDLDVPWLVRFRLQER